VFRQGWAFDAYPFRLARARGEGEERSEPPVAGWTESRVVAERRIVEPIARKEPGILERDPGTRDDQAEQGRSDRAMTDRAETTVSGIAFPPVASDGCIDTVGVFRVRH
jgi:hypothetical protein